MNEEQKSNGPNSDEGRPRGRSVGDALHSFTALMVVAAWFGGVAISTGAWQTFWALFPPYGLYVFVERLLVVMGLL